MKDFVAIDQIVRIEEGSLWGTKGFCGREDYFEAHLPPDNPIVPGLYLLEGLFECARWLTERSSGFTRTLALREVRQAKFQRPVRPGEIVELRVQQEPGDRQIFQGECRCDGTPVAAAELRAESIAVTDPEYGSERATTLRFLLREGA